METRLITHPDKNPVATSVRVDATHFDVILADGRELKVQLAWFPRLHAATHEDLTNITLIAGGVGIHWPALDEDISVAGLLKGYERSHIFQGECSPLPDDLQSTGNMKNPGPCTTSATRSD